MAANDGVPLEELLLIRGIHGARLRWAKKGAAYNIHRDNNKPKNTPEKLNRLPGES